MGSIVSLTVLFCIYAVSELIAMRTRAILSTVLGISVILLAGFWSGILPQSIIKDAQVSGIGMGVVGMLIVSMGTTIDFAELKQEWKVVVTSILCVVFAVAAMLLFHVVLSYVFEMVEINPVVPILMSVLVVSGSIAVIIAWQVRKTMKADPSEILAKE